jgi:hypothetical protein
VRHEHLHLGTEREDAILHVAEDRGYIGAAVARDLELRVAGDADSSSAAADDSPSCRTCALLRLR